MAFLTQCHNDTNLAKFQLFTSILGKEFKIAWSGASSEEVCWLDRIPENLSVDKGSAKTSGQEREGVLCVLLQHWLKLSCEEKGSLTVSSLLLKQTL